MSGKRTRNYKKVHTGKGAVSYKRVAKSAPKKAATKTMQGSFFKRALRRVGRVLSSKWVWGLFGSLFVTAAIAITIGFIYYARMLPDISGLAASKEQPGIEVLASDGSLVARFGQISGNYIPYRDIPEDLINAVLATEDRRFFDHFGVDPWGILRAMVVNVKTGRFVQGGSTITQQLAKNIFLTTDRTLKRKVQELMMSFWLEQKFTKKEILAIYLNRVYLGGGSYGVDAAARFYFNKPVKEITLVESAMLAGLLKAPSRYNPTSNTERAKGRTIQVIRNMLNANVITSYDAENAIAALNDDALEDASSEEGRKVDKVTFKTEIYNNNHFYADWIKEEVTRYIGELKEDVIVDATLDLTAQVNMEAAVADYLTDKVREDAKVSEVAMVAMRPNGEVLAMLGGKDYNESQYNRVTQGMRQPGSSFKLFVYLAALEKGHLPGDVFVDEEIKVGTWKPKNYTERFRGEVHMIDAMAHSINTVAVRLSQMTGMAHVRKLAQKMGVKSKLGNLPSLALGSVEMTLQEMVTAYAHLANGGRAVRPYGIREIRRKRDGKVLYTRTDKDDYSDVTVLKRDVVHKMNAMLNAVMRNGTGKGARIGRSSAGKTGTTSNYKDAWFVGYTPDLVAGVWVGNDNATPMKKVTGGGLPARIWRSFMKASLKDVRARDLPMAHVNKMPFKADEEIMPWLKEDVYVPLSQKPLLSQPVDAPIVKSKGRAIPPKTKENYELDNGFWNKLFDDDGKGRNDTNR